MPTYVYRNLKTNQTFELKQSMSEAALTQHPETGEPVKRLISAPGIAFKGSGFYANDSRPASKASKTGGAAASTPSTTEPASSKTSSAESASSTPSPSANKSGADKSGA